MSNKISYQISIGKLSARPLVLNGQYGKTRSIQISLSKNALRLEVMLTKKYEFKEGDYAHNLLKAILKKAALVHLLKFQTAIEYSNISVQIFENNQKISDIHLQDSLKMFYAIDHKLISQIPSDLQSALVLEKIMLSKQLEIEPDMASVINFIFSKASRFETEKFMYLWMAFNGAYNYHIDCIGKFTDSESEKIALLLNRYDLGSRLLTKKQRDKYGTLAKAKICQIQQPSNKQQVEEVITDLMKLLRTKGIQFDLTCIGYLVGEFSYYLRCSTFHANHRTLLLCYENDHDLKALRIANTFLEDFLNKHLAEIFLMNKCSAQGNDISSTRNRDCN